VNRQRRDAELSLVLKRRELDDVRRKLDGVIEAIADGLRSSGLQSKLGELGSVRPRSRRTSPARQRQRRGSIPILPRSIGRR
jgi:hypothetical protein